MTSGLDYEKIVIYVNFDINYLTYDCKIKYNLIVRDLSCVKCHFYIIYNSLMSKILGVHFVFMTNLRLDNKRRNNV